MKDYDTNFVSALYDRNADKQKAASRRKAGKVHDKYLRRLAAFCGHPAPACLKENDNGETVCKRTYRGKGSKRIKISCNKRFRRQTSELAQRGAYRKVTEFWWDLC